MKKKKKKIMTKGNHPRGFPRISLDRPVQAYRGTSPIKKRPTPQEYHRALGIDLL